MKKRKWKELIIKRKKEIAQLLVLPLHILRSQNGKKVALLMLYSYIQMYSNIVKRIELFNTEYIIEQTLI